MEYQWKINHIEKKLEMGRPPGGPDGSEGAGRVQSGQTLCGWSLCALPAPSRVGRGDCPDEPPCRVAGSGNSRDRYPARGRGGAKRTQRAREEQVTSKRKTYLGAPWGADGSGRGGRGQTRP